MCGIAGLFERDGLHSGTHERLNLMLRALVHRGPDSDGTWLDQNAGIALGHRRLAIVDLTAAGHQPMVSVSGRWVVTYNGEIYNFEALRQELIASGWRHGWHGHSDTEVLLAAIETWGLVAALRRCVGMFAIALWDRETRTLALARDRVGEKPLYYGWVGRQFAFASELGAFYSHPNWNGVVDRGALALLMRHNYIPAPHSIFEGIAKVPPAHVLYLSQADAEARLECYWDIGEIAEFNQSSPFAGTPLEAVDRLEALLKDSISGQMVADVPLGAFLSGGIDSSTVVALMQSMSDRPVRTFTIGFQEEGFNEAEHANVVARHLGTEHTELYVSAQDAIDVIPKLPQIYSEPFSDSSQIPTFLVSQLARQHVTVSLSGDGGDELFSGYTRYALSDKAWSRMSRAPLGLRKGAATAITAISPASWDRILGLPLKMAPSKFRYKAVGDKLHKLAGVLALPDRDAFYRRLVSHWQHPSDLVIGADEPATALTRQIPSLPTFVQGMMYRDLISYLPDDILVKVDRASMAVGLEARVPMLDHRIVEYAWGLPLSYMRRDGATKWPLREVLYRYVPREIVERPKMGFGVPIDAWLRGPLREWAESLLSHHRLQSEGYFDAGMVRTVWQEHLKGDRNWQYLLWDVLMFQAWWDNYSSQLRKAA
jgi:asparagine synthase (glutamine-hydrolysing)